MGFVRRRRLAEVFDRIRRDASLSKEEGSSCSVLIMSAVTVDALCATRILMSVLTAEYIQFKLEPVLGYEDVSAVHRSSPASVPLLFRT